MYITNKIDTIDNWKDLLDFIDENVTMEWQLRGISYTCGNGISVDYPMPPSYNPIQRVTKVGNVVYTAAANRNKKVTDLVRRKLKFALELQDQTPQYSQT